MIFTIDLVYDKLSFTYFDGFLELVEHRVIALEIPRLYFQGKYVFLRGFHYKNKL